MYTLGHDFVPSAIHAGGLRYHGDSPLHSKLTKEGYMEALAYNQQEVFEAAMLFAQTEGFIVAPESAHAVRAAIDFAKMCKKKNVGLRIRKGRLEFDILDNGIGMDAAVQEKLFTPFFSSKGDKGTGLGLFIANKIGEQHGGRIDVTSAPGRGSLFRVIIPKR